MSNQSSLKKTSADLWGDCPSDGPETFMIYGSPRSGKTFKYLQLIQAAHITRNETRAFVINTDKSLFRNLHEFPYLESNEIVKVKMCNSFDEIMSAVSTLIGSRFLTKDDWIILDLASFAWNGCPDYYCRTVLGKSADEIEKDYMLYQIARDKDKGGNALLKYYATGINPMWSRFETAIRNSGCHVIMVCGEKKLDEDGIPSMGKKPDKVELVSNFKQIGLIPDIQKNTPFMYHTIIYCSQPYVKRFFVETAGDKGSREWIPRTETNRTGNEIDFGELYLSNIAGWGRS